MTEMKPSRRRGADSARDHPLEPGKRPRVLRHCGLVHARRARSPRASAQPATSPDVGERSARGAPVAAALELDLALGEALRADDDLPGHADEVHGRELRARPLVAVVVEHVEAGARRALGRARRRRRRSPRRRLQVDEADVERRDGVRPDDAGLVVARLDDRGDEPASGRCRRSPCGPRAPARPGPSPSPSSAPSTSCRNRRYGRPRCRAPTAACRPGLALEGGRVVHLGGRGVERGPAVDDRAAGRRRRRNRCRPAAPSKSR